MKCANCEKEIGRIENSVTTSGFYTTDDGGNCEVALNNCRAKVIQGSERCDECYAAGK